MKLTDVRYLLYKTDLWSRPSRVKVMLIPISEVGWTTALKLISLNIINISMMIMIIKISYMKPNS